MLKHNLIANYLGQGWMVLMGLAFIPLYIRYLGIEAYGLIGFFMILQAWMSLFDMGMTQTLSRELARFSGGHDSNSIQSIHDLVRSIEIIAVIIAILMAISIAMGSDWIAINWLQANELSDEVVAQAFSIMGLVIAARFIEGIYRGALLGLQKHVLLNVANAIVATIQGVGSVIVLAWVSNSIEAFFVWQGVSSIISVFILASMTYSCIPKSPCAGRFSISSLRSVARFSSGMLGITFVALLSTKIDKIILSNKLDLSEFADYALAVVVSGVMFKFAHPVTNTYYPRFCEYVASGDQKSLIRDFHAASKLVSVIAGGFGAILFFYAEPILVLWTQDLSLSARVAPIVNILAMATMVHGMLLVPFRLQLAFGWTSLGLYSGIFGILFLVPAVIIFVEYMKAEGVALALLILYLLQMLVSSQIMFKRILPQEKFHWYWFDVIVPVGLAFFVIGVLDAII